MEVKIVAIQGGLFDDPSNGNQTGFLVAYEGKAPDSVVKLRNKSRKLGYFTKSYPGGFSVRKDDWSVMYKRYNCLRIAATKLDLLAKEIGFVMIENIEMLKEKALS